MAKFNEVQKRRRADKSNKKRAIHGDPLTGRLKNKSQSLSVSGKRKKKLLKQWRRAQKEAMEKGVVSMHDVEMAAGEGTSQDANKTPTKFNVKKALKLKHLRLKGKKKISKAAAADAMVE